MEKRLEKVVEELEKIAGTLELGKFARQTRLIERAQALVEEVRDDFSVAEESRAA